MRNVLSLLLTCLVDEKETVVDENRRIYMLTMIHIALGGVLGYILADNGGMEWEAQAAICVGGTVVAAWHLWSNKSIKPAIPVVALTIAALLAGEFFK